MAANPLPFVALAAGAFFLLRKRDDEVKDEDALVIKPKPKPEDVPADEAGEDPSTPPPGDPSAPPTSNEFQGHSGQTGDGEVRWAVYYTDETSGWPPQQVRGWAWRAWHGAIRYSDSHWSESGMENTKAEAQAAAAAAVSRLEPLRGDLIDNVETDLLTLVSGNYAQQTFAPPLRILERHRDQEAQPRKFTTGIDIYEDDVTDESGQYLGIIKWADDARPQGLAARYIRSAPRSANPNDQARIAELIAALQRQVDVYR
jgi:hypothetical protein